MPSTSDNRLTVARRGRYVHTQPRRILQHQDTAGPQGIGNPSDHAAGIGKMSIKSSLHGG